MTRPTEPEGIVEQLAVLPGQVRPVSAVTIDLPPEPRPYDTSGSALEEAIAEQDGHAVVGFKARPSARSLETGRREAVPASAIEEALELLVGRGVSVIQYYAFIGAAHVQFPPGVATEVRENPLVDFIEPRKWLSVQGVSAPMNTFGPTPALSQTTPWGMELVRADVAWDSATGVGASVQIIDTGHDQGHEDLPDVPSGNCAGTYDGCSDGPFWHGTHVLGVLTSRDNSIGVIGVAPAVDEEDVYVYGACSSSTGFCSTTQIISGIEASIWFDVLCTSTVFT
jgi:subtilisin family serine protease